MQTLYNMTASLFKKISSSDSMGPENNKEDILINVIDPGIILCNEFPLYIKEIQQTIVNYLSGEKSGLYFDRLDNNHPQLKLFDWFLNCDATVIAVHSHNSTLSAQEKEVLLSKFVSDIDKIVPKTIFNHESMPIAHKGEQGIMLNVQDNQPLNGIAIGYDNKSTYLYAEGFPIGEIREGKLFNRRGDLANGLMLSFDGSDEHLYYQGNPIGYFKDGLLINLGSDLPFNGKASDINNDYTCLYHQGKQIGRVSEVNHLPGKKEITLFDNKGELFSGDAPNLEGNGLYVYKDGVGILELQHEASLLEIEKLRENMALFLKSEIPKDDIIIFYLNDAIQSKFESIPEEDPFWSNIQNKRSNFDFRIKTEVFQNESKNSVMEYLAGNKIYTEQQCSMLVDIFIKTDKVHPYLDLAGLFCMKNKIDFSKISYSDNHFFIKGNIKQFIPDDGNCFFHCLDYLSKN